MFAILALSLLPCAQLDELGETLRDANDKSSYENGAYQAAKELAEIRSPEAMELRLELFDEKATTYRGVYLRDWFFSGFLKATRPEEANLMAKAASDKKRSEWQRVLLLRAIGRCGATVSCELMLDKAFRKAPAEVAFEWSNTLGVLLDEKRLDFSDVKLGKFSSAEEMVRAQISEADGPWPGLAFVGTLNEDEITRLLQEVSKAKLPRDRASCLRVLAGDQSGWEAFTLAADVVFGAKAASPKAVYIDAAVKDKVVAAVPGLIKALSSEALNQPNRFSGDLGAALRKLTGQGFGDDPSIWNKWYETEGEDWLANAMAGNADDQESKRVERDTVAKFFGIAIDSANVAFIIDGSGSMSMSKLGDLTCAEAAAEEVDRFIKQLPKEVMFQVVVVEDKPVFAFKKMMPATKSNGAKALKFVNSRQFKSTSALFDALEQVQADPSVDTIVLISDGGSSAGKHQYNGHILDGAERLFQTSGVRIHTVLVTDSTKHEKFMRNLASVTGGRMTVPKD